MGPVSSFNSIASSGDFRVPCRARGGSLLAGPAAQGGNALVGAAKLGEYLGEVFADSLEFARDVSRRA